MKEQLITFETAKLAKEKRFTVPVTYYYDFIGKKCSGSSKTSWNLSKSELYSAPTQSLLQKWLEKTHTIFIDVRTDTNVNEIMGFQIYLKSWKFPPIEVDYVLDKYEGIEKGLQEALKLI